MSTAGCDDSGTRAPSGSTSVTGRSRPPYRFVMIRCSVSAIAIEDSPGVETVTRGAKVSSARSEKCSKTGAAWGEGTAAIAHGPLDRHGCQAALTAPRPTPTIDPHPIERALAYRRRTPPWPPPAPATRPQVFDARQFRDALAQFATGVTIICARAGDGRYVGFTANSFNSVSLEPPLVLWSLARRSASLAAFEAADRYSVNVLSVRRRPISRDASRVRTPIASRGCRSAWAGPTRR